MDSNTIIARFSNGAVEVPVPSPATARNLINNSIIESRTILTNTKTNSQYTKSSYYLFLLSLENQLNSASALSKKALLNDLVLVATFNWKNAPEEYRWRFDQLAELINGDANHLYRTVKLILKIKKFLKRLTKPETYKSPRLNISKFSSKYPQKRRRGFKIRKFLDECYAFRIFSIAPATNYQANRLSNRIA
ncbi:7785_t:CDS:1 [Ambispora leptoticha]|uniref:7785_t:CDS:1 n=1 Tax=Ambispora leptoticha TaxID=144679 RepID=A0A9N9FNT5_9GLOM|nr:7785_t:CDS:1 [Ambispora leptoticha]